MARTSPTRRAPLFSPPLLAFAVGVMAAVAIPSCGSSSPSSGHPVTRQVITQAGGQASISGGRFKLQVPQDALKQDVAITIQPIEVSVAGALGPVYEVGPTGTQFQRPATMSFSFANLSLSSDDVQNLHVAT